MGRKIQASVYIDEDLWETLLELGRSEKASASAQLVEAAIEYVTMPQRKRHLVLMRAAERTRGQSSRARSQ